MPPDRPRRALVLGAGGVLGAAWTVGVLCAMAEAGDDPQGYDLIVGTSAGAVNAGLLGAGLSPQVLRDHQRDIPIPGLVFDHDTATGGALPPRPTLSPGSPRIVARALRHPGQVRPLTTGYALLPRGRGSLAALTAVIEGALPGGTGGWAVRDGVWIVAMDYATGRRVVFGRDGSPWARLSAAVTASCSIPGWYAPVPIGGREYVDGGPSSSTSLDQLAGLRLRGGALDEAVVLAPTASLAYDRPATVATRLERRWRRHSTGMLLREVRQVEAAGTAVRLVTPGPEDLVAIGPNLMDPGRRRQVLETSLRTAAATRPVRLS